MDKFLTKEKKTETSACVYIIGRMEENYGNPLDESKRGEWKSWLKAQHSEN